MASMAVLLGGCLFITSVMANNETHHNEERSQRGIALLGNAYRSFHSGNYPSCLIACMDDSNCMSFNFWWNSSKCDLNNKTKHTAELKFLAQDVPATYMGLMREPGINHSRPSPTRASSPTPMSSMTSSSLVKRSCKHVNLSSGDGYYSIDPKLSGNPLTVYCDMTTDGGGWTLIYRTILQKSEKLYSLVFVNNYRDIFNYKNNQLVNVTVLNQFRQDMGFSQIRFYCHKKLVGRTLHIMTKDSPEGEMVIRYFTNSSERPQSCGSFKALPDDTSTASQQCSKWGFGTEKKQDGKWGTARNNREDRLHREPILVRFSSKHALYTSPIDDRGKLKGMFYCDDHWDSRYRKAHSPGDTWLIFVR